jgi:ectoine hydroxylase-related dioxygenase (phytanoyl-CoA dioxygenase family)
LHSAVGEFRSAEKPAAEMPWAHPCITQPGDLLLFNLKLWHQGTANEVGTHRRVIFWSVGQQATEFNELARRFNENVGRGNENEPWPDSFVQNAPRRRLDYLRVYAPGTKKAIMLSSAVG